MLPIKLLLLFFRKREGVLIKKFRYKTYAQAVLFSIFLFNKLARSQAKFCLETLGKVRMV